MHHLDWQYVVRLKHRNNEMNGKQRRLRKDKGTALADFVLA